MSEEVVVLKTFNNEIEAGMAQQMLQEAGCDGVRIQR